MTVYVLYYCRLYEWLAEPGRWGRVKGGRGIMWLRMFYIIVEDMNGWLSRGVGTEGGDQEVGDGFMVEGESRGCLCFVLLQRI